MGKLYSEEIQHSNFGEAIALATVMEKVVEHVNAKPEQ